MELAHLYTKLRKDFGKHCKFGAVPAELILEGNNAIPSTDAYAGNYILRNPSTACFDTAPHMYVHIHAHKDQTSTLQTNSYTHTRMQTNTYQRHTGPSMKPILNAW